MLVITQLPSGQLSIKADYFYKDRIKNIPTAKTKNPEEDFVPRASAKQREDIIKGIIVLSFKLLQNK